MTVLRSFRLWHRWISIVTLPAFSVMLLTGVLLATRGFNPWLQPTYADSKFALETSFAKILETAQSVPEAQIKSWQDVSQIDIRPKTGLIRVRSKHGMYELQINGASGELVATSVRRVSWITAIHEGAYFGPWVRYGLFFTSALGVTFLLLSGTVLALAHYRRKLLSSNPKSESLTDDL